MIPVTLFIDSIKKITHLNYLPIFCKNLLDGNTCMKTLSCKCLFNPALSYIYTCYTVLMPTRIQISPQVIYSILSLLDPVENYARITFCINKAHTLIPACKMQIQVFYMSSCISAYFRTYAKIQYAFFGLKKYVYYFILNVHLSLKTN